MGDELPLLGPRSSLARLPEALVRRPRLDSLLADGARRQVTLISAPPGSGKTTLVTAWLASRRRRDVMLTVDARDNERDQLAGVIVAALVDRGAVVPEEIDATLPGTTLLDAAFAQLEQRSNKRVLVLDDLQELTSRHALRTLAYLVERAPASLDLVLCSRADPPIRLTRLRLEDRLAEIRNDSLAFDLAETSALLTAHGLALTRAQVQALWRRTEGWVAGLRLAACALQGEADPAEFVQGAAGTETAIADYLLKELLTRQDEAIQQFMLRTSVVGRLTPDLAEVLTGDAGGVQAARRAGTERGVPRGARGPSPGTATTRCSRRSWRRACASSTVTWRTSCTVAPPPGSSPTTCPVRPRSMPGRRGTGRWWGGSPPNAGSPGPSMAPTRTTACWRACRPGP